MTSIRECLCQLCDTEYPVWFAPNKLWNSVMRDPDGADKYAFVCMNCFAKEAEKKGIKPTAWRLGTERITAEATDVQLSSGVRANHTVPSELAKGVEGSNK
jgi:hypothetical protein